MANLRELRKRAGLTGAQAADMAGVSAGHLFDFERGDRVPTVPVLVKLLKAAGQGNLARRIIRWAQPASLKRLRVARGWTQADAGGELDVTLSQSALSQIESGRAELSADTLADLLAAYGRDEQADELRRVLEPSYRHGNHLGRSAAEKQAMKAAWYANRGNSNGRNDPGHLAGVAPQADPIRTPDGREVRRSKRPARPLRTA
jgi:transcriptional regulator with XRE-family HTH domain